MKRLLILLILLFPLSLWAEEWKDARMNVGIVGGGVPAGGCILQDDASAVTVNPIDGDRTYGDSTPHLIGFEPATAYTITQIGFYPTKYQSPGANPITAKIYDSAMTILGTSTNSVNADIIDGSEQKFQFSGIALTGAVIYYIGIHYPYENSVNCVRFGFSGSGTYTAKAWDGYWATIDSSATGKYKTYSGVCP